MIHWNISGNSSLCVGTLHKFIELLYINAQEIGPFPILDYRRRGKARHVEGQTETDERIAKAESATEANTPKSQALTEPRGMFTGAEIGMECPLRRGMSSNGTRPYIREHTPCLPSSTQDTHESGLT